ncbi:MAG: hypothetical protein PHG06_12380 [Parabacteroides sp.]|jgi:hypothetical protein|nr:hypothetical protein [Parabacteroides sp.]
MKRVNVMVSDEAKEKLINYQKYHRMNTQDEALDKILLAMEVPNV